MYRNDPILPTFSLILALGLFYMAYLDGLHIARLLGHTPEELSVGPVSYTHLTLPTTERV